MKSTHNKDAFNRLSIEKRNRIVEAAVTEFADYGYDKANINTIAKKANISVGAIYKYFNNKQDLYLTIIDFSVEKLKTVLNEIISSEDDLFITIEKIINAIQLFSKSEIYLTRLYNKMTTENDPELVLKTTYNMEGITANLYSSMIKKAQDNGEVRKDVNSRYFAFFLDNA
jgi:AcrR family transcriptional regulator